MIAQSAKAKGRRLQQWVRDQLIEQLDVHPEDIESRGLGDVYKRQIHYLGHSTGSHQKDCK